MEDAWVCALTGDCPTELFRVLRPRRWSVAHCYSHDDSWQQTLHSPSRLCSQATESDRQTSSCLVSIVGFDLRKQLLGELEDERQVDDLGLRDIYPFVVQRPYQRLPA